MNSKFKSLILFSIIVFAIGTTASFFIARWKYTEEDINLERFPNNKTVPIDSMKSEISKMSLDEKIGQLLIIGFENRYLDEHISKMITEYHIGGINLLKRNVKDSSQVKQLVKDLQKISTIPLFVAADQEGGYVNRFIFLKESSPQIQIADAQQAENVALQRALGLKDLGVNMNFSPVLDYVSDPSSYLYSRTFGKEPDDIAKLGEAMIRGYIKGGIIPVAKHFPGYGNIVLDPHIYKVVLILNEHELEQSLTPFKGVSADGSALAIMTAHISIPSVDVKPATLSSKFIKGVLRTQLSFKGVIITDDIEMASVGIPIEEAAIEAIKAGADIIISTYTPQKQIQIINALKVAILTGEIPEERINESVARILKLKSLLPIDNSL